MSEQEQQISIRETAQAVIRVIEDAGTNADKLRQGLLDATEQFRHRPDIRELGTRRLANHIANANSKHIYYDGELSMTFDLVPTGKVIPPHDHGLWEGVMVCSGRLQHAIYQRVDDGSVEGHAELELVEDRIISADDMALVIPPAEIHSFEALDEETYLLNVVNGNYRAKRHYFNIEANSCVFADAGTFKSSPPPAPAA